MIRNPFGLPSDVSPLPMLRMLHSLDIAPSFGILNGTYASTEDAAAEPEDSEEEPMMAEQNLHTSSSSLAPPPPLFTWTPLTAELSPDATAAMFLLGPSMSMAAKLSTICRLSGALTLRLKESSLGEVFATTTTTGRNPPGWVQRKVLIQDERGPSPSVGTRLVAKSLLDCLSYSFPEGDFVPCTIPPTRAGFLLAVNTQYLTAWRALFDVVDCQSEGMKVEGSIGLAAIVEAVTVPVPPAARASVAAALMKVFLE